MSAPEEVLDRPDLHDQVPIILAQCSLMKGVVNDELGIEKIEQGRLRSDLVPSRVREALDSFMDSFMDSL